MTDSQQQRNHYRIRYPVSERPTLEVDGLQFEVLELSECGLRISVLKGIWPTLPPPAIDADVTLACGQTRSITAAFFRQEERESVYRELSGVFSSDIMQEQRYLIKKYPSFGVT